MLDDGGFLPPLIPGGGDKWEVDIRYMKDQVVLGGFNIFVRLDQDTPIIG